MEFLIHDTEGLSNNHMLLCIAFSKVTKLVISELVITSPINFKFVCSTNSFNALKNESLLKGASINYVSKILPIFDPLTLRNQVYYISLVAYTFGHLPCLYT